MFIVKFAMVLYLNTGAFWAEKDSSGNSGLGVFSVLMSGQDYLASIFVDALQKMILLVNVVIIIKANSFFHLRLFLEIHL